MSTAKVKMREKKMRNQPVSVQFPPGGRAPSDGKEAHCAGMYLGVTLWYLHQQVSSCSSSVSVHVSKPDTVTQAG